MKKYITWVALLAIGIICFVVKWIIWSSVDANGTLHEPFWLIPIGYLFILLGIIFLIVAVMRWLKDKYN